MGESRLDQNQPKSEEKQFSKWLCNFKHLHINTEISVIKMLRSSLQVVTFKLVLLPLHWDSVLWTTWFLCVCFVFKQVQDWEQYFVTYSLLPKWKPQSTLVTFAIQILRSTSDKIIFSMYQLHIEHCQLMFLFSPYQAFMDAALR